MQIGFIGSGKMASALAEGVLRAKLFAPEEMLVADHFPAAAEALAERTGARGCVTNAELAAKAETILLCVKPADVPAALQEAGSLDGKLLISIAAGVTLQRLGECASGRPRLVRVMPNTPALIGKGAAAYAGAAEATAEDLQTTERIFGAAGLVVPVREELLDAITGLSGSGPAYIYTVIEAMAEGAVEMGLPRDVALQLSAQTVLGAAAMVLETGLPQAKLRDQVTSPGGTTLAGLQALEAAGLRGALIAAVKAATERSRELGK